MATVTFNLKSLKRGTKKVDINDWDELVTLVNKIVTLVNELKADFNDHCHQGDGSQAGTYFTSRPRSDNSTVTGGTAQTVAAADADSMALD